MMVLRFLIFKLSFATALGKTRVSLCSSSLKLGPHSPASEEKRFFRSAGAQGAVLRGGCAPTWPDGALLPCGHRGYLGTSRCILPASGLQPKMIKSIVCTFNKIKCTKIEPFDTTSIFKLHHDMFAVRKPHGARALRRTDGTPERAAVRAGV